MRNKCKNCDKNCENGDLCFRCKPRSPLPKITKLKSRNTIPTKEEVEDSIDRIVIRNTFFESIWKERSHYSEISNTFLGNEILSIYFHHILPKNKIKEAEFDKENIILLTGDEHTSVESDMYKYPKINELREKLKTKYNL